MSDYGTVATLPLAPGTPSTCYTYYNYYDSPHRPAMIEPSQQHFWTPPPKICETIASIIDVDVEELIRLNPSLDRGNCVVQPGFSYCAEETRETRKTSTCKYLRYRLPSWISRTESSDSLLTFCNEIPRPANLPFRSQERRVCVS